jgi:hypothetical protein
MTFKVLAACRGIHDICDTSSFHDVTVTVYYWVKRAFSSKMMDFMPFTSLREFRRKAKFW